MSSSDNPQSPVSPLELKPCPFCGSVPEMARVLNFPPDDWQWYVMCCCEVNPAAWNTDQAVAVAQWNRRANGGEADSTPVAGAHSEKLRSKKLEALQTFVRLLGLNADKVAAALSHDAGDLTCKQMAVSALRLHRDFSGAGFGSAGIEASNAWLDSLAQK